MRILDRIRPGDVEKFLQEFARLQRSMPVGDVSCLIRELQKRSLPRPAIDILIRVCAIYWGRALLEELEFEFSDALTLIVDGEAETISLSSWHVYQTVGARASIIEVDWLNCLAKSFSTEYAEIVGSMPITGEFKVASPTIYVAAE